jgi:hypothetical protein
MEYLMKNTNRVQACTVYKATLNRPRSLLTTAGLADPFPAAIGPGRARTSSNSSRMNYCPYRDAAMVHDNLHILMDNLIPLPPVMHTGTGAGTAAAPDRPGCVFRYSSTRTGTRLTDPGMRPCQSLPISKPRKEQTNGNP